VLQACPNCGQTNVEGPECPRCGVILAKAAAHRQMAELPLVEAAPVVDEAPVRVEPMSSAMKLELLAVPAALVLGALVQLTNLGRFLVGASAEMEMHELGHATALWFAGRLAVPLPMITLGTDGSRSIVMFAVVAAGLAVTASMARRENLPRVMIACAVLGVDLVLGTLFLSGPRLDAWVKFAGMGGEAWLSALALILFHEKLPLAFRWELSRWFFLVWGGLAFCAGARRWLVGEIPWGSFWGGDGDMDILRDLHDWSERDILHTYRWVTVLCLMLVLARVIVRAMAQRTPASGLRA